MDKVAVYSRAALELVAAPEGYEWGKENRLGADCSGVVSYALIRSGWVIRATADGLYRHVFTENIDNLAEVHFPFDPSVLVWVAQMTWTHGSGKPMGAGTAKHIAALVGNGLAVNADSQRDGIEVRPIGFLIERYSHLFCRVLARRLSYTQAAAYSGKLVSGLDQVLADDLEVNR